MPNAITYSRFLFTKLLGELVTDEEREKLCLKKTEYYEKEFDHFLRLKISGSGELLHDVKWISYELKVKPGTSTPEGEENKTFIGFSGCKFQEKDLKSLENAEIYEHDIHAGIFLRLVKDINLDLSGEVSSIHLEQDLASQHLDPLYNGHDYDEIKKIF